MGYVLKDFSVPALVGAIEANQLGYLADLGRSPQVELHDDPEVTWFITGFPFPRLNRVLRAQFELDDIDAKIEAMLVPFKSRKVPMIWHTGPTTRPIDLGQRLIAHGLTHSGDEPGMAIYLLALEDEPPMPPGLTIESVSDAETLRKWSHTLTLAFDWSEGAGDALFGIEAKLSLGQNQPRRLYVGWLKGKPVATSILFLGAGVAGIYGVATVPEARGQGIGKAMTLVPLLEARVMGYRIGALHASPMGLGIYRRLGFQEYCKLGRYVWTGETNQV
jgi:ribosomal protein S18 acetylase RimI-like enzyme